jgi:hypothetical protein
MQSLSRATALRQTAVGCGRRGCGAVGWAGGHPPFCARCWAVGWERRIYYVEAAALNKLGGVRQAMRGAGTHVWRYM